MCPIIMDLLANHEKLDEIKTEERPETSIPLYDNWDKVAKRLINQIWRCNAAKIFHKPVDPDKLGIPDYFEIVKEPIDLGTIKQRLNYNYYSNIKDFTDDIQRCFDNCLLFNGEDSPAGQRCLVVIEEFKKLYVQLNV